MVYSIESRSLTLEEMTVNAQYILDYLTGLGWTKNAVCGMLGNMQSESSINPARWQSDDIGNFSGGYGLVQWTPASKFIDWCSANGYDRLDINSALTRILWEVETSTQWYSSNPMTFKQFTTSTESPYDLGMLFGAKYERYLNYDTNPQVARGNQAQYWYDTLVTGTIPDPPPTKKEYLLPLALSGAINLF